MIVVRMLNFSKLHFEAVNISGNNYLTWAVDAEMYDIRATKNKSIDIPSSPY